MALVMADHARPAETGHGHVTPRKDGVKARCGGPAICPECSMELARKNSTERIATLKRDNGTL